ncbi:type IV pilin [Haloprofundus halobius]|uniref:type IV pilin n=1 Tax=Haloprofundus halobius TaxID=2876194 RepID=UPI001CCC1A9E|nr:type IV pilin [Haloprofundus halobius]
MPVVGVALLLAVVVALSAVGAYVFLGLSEEREPAPEVVLELSAEEGEVAHALSHEQGRTLEGEKVTLRGTTDPEALSGSELAAGEAVELLPTDEEVRVVWTGEHGASYTLKTFTVERTVPEPDVGCPWVDSETDDGVEKLDVDGHVVDCDAETEKDVELTTGGVIIGDTRSGAVVDADGATFYGDVVAERLVNHQDGPISGSVSSNDDVKIDGATVGESAEADDETEIVAGSTVGGDAGGGDLVKVLDSDVSGSVASDGSVKLQDATVEGDVYVPDGGFDCTNSTVGGENCGEYTPKDPDER